MWRADGLSTADGLGCIGVRVGAGIILAIYSEECIANDGGFDYAGLDEILNEIPIGFTGTRPSSQTHGQ